MTGDSQFVRTRTGHEIHIGWPRGSTFCGRSWTEPVDAVDALWFRICGKCRRSAEAFGDSRHA